MSFGTDPAILRPPTETASYHVLELIPASAAVPATTENQYDEKDD